MIASLALLIAVSLVAGTVAVSVGQSARSGTTSTTAADDPPAILVSRQLLEAEGLAVGDIVRLAADPSGQGARRFRIVGSYEPTPDPLRVTTQRLETRLHLGDLLALTADPADPLSRETVDAINVALVDPGDARAFADDLWAKVPGLVVRATAREDAYSPFVVIERFHFAIAIVTLIASTVFLLALMVMRAEERRETVVDDRRPQRDRRLAVESRLHHDGPAWPHQLQGAGQPLRPAGRVDRDVERGCRERRRRRSRVEVESPGQLELARVLADQRHVRSGRAQHLTDEQPQATVADDGNLRRGADIDLCENLARGRRRLDEGGRLVR